MPRPTPCRTARMQGEYPVESCVHLRRACDAGGSGSAVRKNNWAPVRFEGPGASIRFRINRSAGGIRDYARASKTGSVSNRAIK